ncbi:3-hydroxyacyl-CoA dehydrogenase/enoyl-CoA hydratase family protein [Ramlibacter sp. WS9]|uniref:3-hydroxyacyl-CoA dehydrogenase/enoyl-CoA hydratase family protein n=1 Tax=Ramlibacter sp. WS9 TaxID=1882741 RepID=UPI001144DC26|nr:3-hydroxyacyl-CoA dehydrogenase/enoyl-CoA hydratase family protein [Ramlibacter sp. WS9]ROZ68728.1 3-hydroxyacyl-CoA dehydrogenase/enoyl-CoA hydratase family protein [Ramlibacter sp. WS9]
MTNKLISKAAVVGAGNMGAGIAAHLANAGVPVILLDRVDPQSASRNSLAEQAVQRQLKTGGFMHADRASLIETGNVEDDLHRVSEADWIVEAVFEDLAIKQELYRKLEPLRKPRSIVSSNTSTIPLHQLTEGLPLSFQEDFVVTHFFNPPRVMKLLELVGGAKTLPTTLQRAGDICDHVLGKTVISCRDTPGFIANRIGNYWMSVAVLEAMALGLTVEEADAVMGQPFGIPRTGIFGLFDYVGLNLVPLVWGSFMKALAADDAHRRHDITRNPLIADMTRKGWTGRGAGAGFYRTRDVDGRKVREALDLVKGDYHAVQPAALESLSLAARDLKALCEQPDRGGQYAWRVLSHAVVYAAEVGPEIADDVAAIDTAMKLGYNWSAGPFELADKVGADWIAKRLQAQGDPVPPLLARAAAGNGFYGGGVAMPTSQAVPAGGRVANGGTLSLTKKSKTPVAGNAAASLWDLGEGVLGLEVHTKMNACNEQVVEVIESAPSHVSRGFRALVVASDHPRAFSVGADLGSFVSLVKAGNWAGLTAFVKRGQDALYALAGTNFPVVAAPFGLALGGGCELQLACDASVAHAELNAGLPELKVGILPGWGGCMRLLQRWTLRNEGDVVAGAQAALAVILDGTPSGSALLARDKGLLRESDPITMNRDRLVADAHAHAIALSGAGYSPAPMPQWISAGPVGFNRLVEQIDAGQAAGKLTGSDVQIARAIAYVMTGGSAAAGSVLTATDILRLEVECMVSLAKTDVALARMEHMLATGKPLRN